MPEDFTNRELGIMLLEIKEDTSNSLDRIEVTTTEIKEEAKKTNGRIKRLESWKTFLAGGQALLVILLPLITFLVIKWFDSYQKQQDATVSQKINMAIEAYDKANFEK